MTGRSMPSRRAWVTSRRSIRRRTYPRPSFDGRTPSAMQNVPGRVHPPQRPEAAVLAALPSPHDPAGRDAHALDPDALRVPVGLEHGHPQPTGVDAVPLGDELVGPGERVALEGVPEAEVPEHLEERQMAGVVPDVLDVGGAHALLAGCRPGEGRLLVSEAIGHE